MKDSVQKILATWFGVGYFPVASGTAGTAAAMPVYALTALVCQQFRGAAGLVYATITVGLIVLSLWAADCGERHWGKSDAGQIVIDEVAGYFVTMFLLPFTWQWMVAGFFVFRLFDIVKPPPASTFDKKVKGGAGVTLDDVAAGVYGCIALHLVRVFLL